MENEATPNKGSPSREASSSEGEGKLQNVNFKFKVQPGVPRDTLGLPAFFKRLPLLLITPRLAG